MSDILKEYIEEASNREVEAIIESKEQVNRSFMRQQVTLKDVVYVFRMTALMNNRLDVFYYIKGGKPNES